MYNWRFLILALLAALHPISCFSKCNPVDGRGQCTDNDPKSLLLERRLSYGSQRLVQPTEKDNRLNINRNIRENRRYEIDYSVILESLGERRLADKRSERDIGRVSRATFRVKENDMRRADAREGDRRLREFTTVERDAHRITTRDISRLERDRVRETSTFSAKANNERNRFSMESWREPRNRDALSEYRNQKYKESRDLLQRARDDVISGDRRERRDSIRYSRHRLSRSLDLRDHRAKDRVATRQELNRNQFRQDTRRTSARDPKNSLSRSRSDHTAKDMVEARQSLNQIEYRLNKNRDFTRGLEHRISRSLERQEHRAIDKMETHNELHQNLPKKYRQATERLNEGLTFSSRQDTRVQEESRSNRHRENDAARRASREMANYKDQRSRSESRQLDQRVSGQNDRRMYVRNVENRRIRSGSFLMDENRERQSVDRRERERESVDRVHDERRVSRINVRSPLVDDRRQSVDRRFEENQRQSVERSERNSVYRVRNERMKSRINLRETPRVRDKDDLQHLRRDTITRPVQNSEQRGRETLRTTHIRNVRQSLESDETSRDFKLERRDFRRSIRNDDRDTKTFNQIERTKSRFADRSVERQISRNWRRDERINARTENGMSRNLEHDEYRFRSDVRFTENHDNFALRYETQRAENIATINWQYLFYTLQTIYLCGIFVKMLSRDVTGHKTRPLQWWSGPSHKLVKVD